MSNVPQEERFLRILFPADAKAGRHVLRQLTVGHLLLLRRLRNPFGQVVSVEDMEFGFGDLAMAITVCSMDWRDAWALVRGNKWRMRWKVWLNTDSDPDVAAVTAVMFNNYVLDSFDRPSTIERAGSKQKQRRLNAPYWQVIIRRICAKGLTLDQALDTPVKKAVWDAACEAEESGAVQWSSDVEEAVQEKVKRAIEELNSKVPEPAAN